MELISDYENAIKAIYGHVGFKEGSIIYPIDVCTDKFWNTDGESVFYADTYKEFEKEEGNFYTDVICKQNCSGKWIYEGEKITMIICDSHVQGMRFFRIFDNSKLVF